MMLMILQVSLFNATGDWGPGTEGTVCSLHTCTTFFLKNKRVIVAQSICGLNMKG